MTITINGTSGITLPSGSAAVGTTDSQTMTNKTIGSGYAGSTVTAGTAVASTSGTSIDFTGIPSWVKRITVMFNGVSTNGTSPLLVQLGSGSATTTGYTSGASGSSGSLATTTSTAGFILNYASVAAGTSNGVIPFTNVSGNIWVSSGVLNLYTTGNNMSGGTVTLSGTLDRVRITTVNGTDTFDAGSINILYE